MGTAQGTGEPRPGRVPPPGTAQPCPVRTGEVFPVLGRGGRAEPPSPVPAPCGSKRCSAGTGTPPPRRLPFRQPISRLRLWVTGWALAGPEGTSPGDAGAEVGVRALGSVIFPARLQPPPSPARRRAGAPGCTPGGEVKIPFRPNTAQTLNHIKCVPLFFLPHLRPVPPRFQAVHQEQSPAPGRVGAAPPACEARTQAGWDLHGQQEASEQSDLHLLWKAP